MGKKGIKISMLTNLTVTFESLIKGWHEEHIREIKEKLGEYILSIDGTYPYRGKTLYIFRSYENGCMRIPRRKMMHRTYNHCSRRSLKCTPMAVISDMQPAIIESVKNVMPGIPHQYCQYHFLKNAGSFMGDHPKKRE